MKSYLNAHSLVGAATRRHCLQPRHQSFHSSATFPHSLQYPTQQHFQRIRHISASASRLASSPHSTPHPPPSSNPLKESSALPAPNSLRQQANTPPGGLSSISTPAYDLSITCKPKPPLPQCGHRSTHRISKQGYFKGTILVQCPKCENRHLIADHLKIFSDKSVTIEDIMRENGEMVKRGMIAANGDVELWDYPPTAQKDAEAKLLVSRDR